MIELLVGCLIALCFLFLGYISRALKKCISMLMKLIYLIADKLRIKVNQERKLKFTTNFYEQYDDIKIVTRSKLGMKKKKLYNPFMIIITIVSLALIIANLKYWNGSTNIISNWIEQFLLSVNVSETLLNVVEISTVYTAVTFSLLSFGLSSILKSWKESRDLRRERKIKKQNDRVISRLSSSELTKRTIEKIEKETTSSNTIDLV